MSIAGLSDRSSRLPIFSIIHGGLVTESGADRPAADVPMHTAEPTLPDVCGGPEARDLEGLAALVKGHCVNAVIVAGRW
jgi:hypothetical protein